MASVHLPLEARAPHVGVPDQLTAACDIVKRLRRKAFQIVCDVVRRAVRWSVV